MQVEIELAFGTAEPADIDDAAEDFCRFEAAVNGRPRDHVDDEVDAIAAGGLLHVLGPFRVGGVDREIAAEFLEPSAAARISRCPHHYGGTQRLTDLQTHQADARAGALDKEGLAALEPAGSDDGIVQRL